MKQFSNLYFLFIATFLMLFSSLPMASEENSIYQVKVVTEYLEPYQIENSDGSLGGFATDVVHALFKQAKSDANIHVMPWARAYEIAKAEKNIMIFSMARTPSREPLFQWIGSLKEEKLFFWGLSHKFPNPVKTTALLKGYKIAASRHSNVAQYLIENNFFNVYQLVKEDQNMLMLYRGRVDLIMATELTLRNRAKKLGLDFNKMSKVKPADELQNDLSIAFNLQSDIEMVKYFQKSFQEIKALGIIEELKKKWHIDK